MLCRVQAVCMDPVSTWHISMDQQDHPPKGYKYNYSRQVGPGSWFQGHSKDLCRILEVGGRSCSMFLGLLHCHRQRRIPNVQGLADSKSPIVPFRRGQKQERKMSPWLSHRRVLRRHDQYECFQSSCSYSSWKGMRCIGCTSDRGYLPDSGWHVIGSCQPFQRGSRPSFGR